MFRPILGWESGMLAWVGLGVCPPWEEGAAPWLVEGVCGVATLDLPEAAARPRPSVAVKLAVS